MGRILSLLLGLVVVAFLAYQVMYHRGVVTAREPSEASAPKQALDNARGAASRIEAEQEKRAAEALEKSRE